MEPLEFLSKINDLIGIIFTRCYAYQLFYLIVPLFMMTYLPISQAAMVRKVEWKPIEHKAAMSLSDVAKKR